MGLTFPYFPFLVPPQILYLAEAVGQAMDQRGEAMRGRIARFWPQMAALVALAVMAAVWPPAAATGSGDYPYPGSGDWRITQDTRLTEETVVVQGDIIIESGAKLLLVDSTVQMNCSYPNQYRLHLTICALVVRWTTELSFGEESSAPR